jgi:hypothetical protein
VRVYIAGPMTGFPAYNVGHFMAVAGEWAAAGHDVTTPFDCNSEVWHRHHGRPFNPHADRCEYGDPLLREMYAADVAALLASEQVVALDGWEKSTGAQREVLLAQTFGVPVVTEGGDPIAVKIGVTQTRTDESALEEAQRLVHGNRGADYGHPIDDYTRTGRIWGAILGIPDIDPRICCIMMAAVKVSREVNKHKRDNLVDLAGYAECAHMVAERQGLP